MVPEELAVAIRQEVRAILNEEFLGASPLLTGTFVAPEGVDGNLSEIVILGDTFHFVPRSGDEPLVAGDSLLLVRTKSIPLTIVGVLKGDITLATA